MYILVITRGVPAESYPLNGMFEWDQAKALHSIGNKVVVACIDIRSARRRRKWGINFYKKDEIPVVEYNFPLGRCSHKIQAVTASLSLRRLYRDIEKQYGRPDILHAHFGNIIGYAAAKLGKAQGLPLVITEHSSSLMEKKLKKEDVQLFDYSLNSADRIIAVSEGLSDRIKTLFGCESDVVYNVVDVNDFCYRERINKDGVFRFLSVGNYIKRKGHINLLQAFNMAFSDIPNVKLTFYGGDGPEKKNVFDLVQSLGIENKIEVKGFISRQDFAAKLHEADCFVLASLAETFGVVFIEALAAGCPVIATRCGGPEAYVQDTWGKLVDVGDIEGMANMLLYMYHHADKFDRKEISANITDQFSQSVIAHRIQDVLYKTKTNCNIE